MTTEEKPRPKPAPPKAPNKPVATPTKENEKPKFVRKPHLTEKPFRAHEGLQNLKKQMEQSSKKPQRKPVRRNNKEKK